MKNYSKIIFLIAFTLVILPACKLQKDEVPVEQPKEVEKVTEVEQSVVVPDEVEPPVQVKDAVQPVSEKTDVVLADTVPDVKMPEITPISDDNSAKALAEAVLPCNSRFLIADIERCKVEEYFEAKGVEAELSDFDVTLLLSAFLPIGAEYNEDGSEIVYKEIDLPVGDDPVVNEGSDLSYDPDEYLVDSGPEFDISKCDLLSVSELRSYCRESVQLRSNQETNMDSL